MYIFLLSFPFICGSYMYLLRDKHIIVFQLQKSTVSGNVSTNIHFCALFICCENKNIQICDMIKGNESNVAIIDFELYRLKEVTSFNVLHCLEIQRFAHISGTRFRIVMGFGSKCRILNGPVDYILGVFCCIARHSDRLYMQLITCFREWWSVANIYHLECILTL